MVRISPSSLGMNIPEDLWDTTWSPVSNLIRERAGYAELLQGSHALRRQSIRQMIQYLGLKASHTLGLSAILAPIS